MRFTNDDLGRRVELVNGQQGVLKDYYKTLGGFSGGYVHLDPDPENVCVGVLLSKLTFVDEEP